MKTADSTMYGNPIISEMNQVANFNPLKYLRNTANGPVLDLKYKMIWFKLKYPNGKIRVSNLRITDQLAIIEARVFLDRRDANFASNFTAQCDKTKAPNGDFIKAAQNMAIDRALSDAGFGIQFSAKNAVKSAPTNNVTANVAPPVKKTAPVVNETAPASAPPIKMAESVANAVNTVAEPNIKKDETIQERSVGVAVPQKSETVDHNTPVVEANADVNAAPTVAEKVIPMNNANTSGQPIAVENDPLIPVAQALKNSGLVTETPNEVAAASTPTYTKDMSVEDICAVMTLEEAENYVVPSGACVGQTMAMVADRRPASLRFYINGYSGNDNILRAAATVITRARPELLAG